MRSETQVDPQRSARCTNCIGLGHWVVLELETPLPLGAIVDSGEKLLSGRVSQRGGKGTFPETQVDPQRSARCTNCIGLGHWVVSELETPLPLGAIVDSGEKLLSGRVSQRGGRGTRPETQVDWVVPKCKAWSSFTAVFTLFHY